MPNRLGCGTIHVGKQSGDSEHLEAAGPKPAGARLSIRLIRAVPLARSAALDHDDFGLNQSKIMNVIDSKSLERDAGGKPVSTFPHPALAAGASRREKGD
ncbi:MAG: hypothetical protein M3178_04090 [Pseudomonadota bacterium]|nr:hypothetical protein [Pseudomonadota bacterium]